MSECFIKPFKENYSVLQVSSLQQSCSKAEQPDDKRIDSFRFKLQRDDLRLPGGLQSQMTLQGCALKLASKMQKSINQF